MTAQSTLQETRIGVLFSLGATMQSCQALLALNDNPLQQRGNGKIPNGFPLMDALHVETWHRYAKNAGKTDLFQTLCQRLPQFSFPIERGISETKAYQAATKRGVFEANGAKGLILKEPTQVRLAIHQSLAGAIPVLSTPHRADFVSLVQALTKRNEPHPIPRSMGACFVSGYNNWDRLHTLRREWEAKNAGERLAQRWAAEFLVVIKPNTALYQDSFLICHEGDYSGVSAETLSLPPDEWQRIATKIRLAHECTHYLTRRVFHAKGNALVDEVVADYWGIRSALGSFRADWLLRFLGLEDYPNYREGGRLQNYYARHEFSAESQTLLHTLIKTAVDNLESFDRNHGHLLNHPNTQAQLVLNLSCLTLEEMCHQNFVSNLAHQIERAQPTSTEV